MTPHGMGEVESLEAHYSDLRQKLNTGALTPDAFRREVAKLWFEDADGHTWMLGAQTGHWYVYRNDQWEPASPPRDASVHTINCPRCEEPVEAGSAFCGHCGLRLSDAPPESQLEPE